MILLIDNDDISRNRLIASLSWLGEDVYAFNSPVDLPPLSALARPSLLVARYELPDEDGLTFADRFHELYPDVPIFLLTGAWSADLAEQVAMRSFLWLRQVPAGFEELCTLIGSLCGRRTSSVGVFA